MLCASCLGLTVRLLDQRLKPKRILKHLILMNQLRSLKHKRIEFSNSSFSWVTERPRQIALATATPQVRNRSPGLSPVPNSSQQLNSLSPQDAAAAQVSGEHHPLATDPALLPLHHHLHGRHHHRFPSRKTQKSSFFQLY